MKKLIQKWYDWEVKRRYDVMDGNDEAEKKSLMYRGLEVTIVDDAKFQKRRKDSAEDGAIWMMIVRPLAGFFIIGLAIKIIIAFSIWVVTV